MKRKNLIYILVCGALLTSCSDYLETPPSAELDENKVFADRTLTESYLTGVYAEGMPLGFSMNSSDADRKLAASSTLASACDEAEEGGVKEIPLGIKITTITIVLTGTKTHITL